jgi:hypothetical protein
MIYAPKSIKRREHAIGAPGHSVSHLGMAPTYCGKALDTHGYNLIIRLCKEAHSGLYTGDRLTSGYEIFHNPKLDTSCGKFWMRTRRVRTF